MKPYSADLIRALSMAIGLVMVITLFGHYVIPPYIFVSPGYSFYAAGIVDHKSIGQGYSGGGEPKTWYTVSIRLFDDDPVNRIQSGETLGYIVTKSEWEMVEWGDTIKIRLLPDVRAEIVELFPSLKLPEWHGLAGSASPINVEIVLNKSTYGVNEKASFHAIIRNSPEGKGWTGNPIPLRLTLFKTFPFWIFKDGGKVFSLPGDSELQEIVLQPGQEIKFSFEWNLVDDQGNSVPEGIYYVRVYLGYFTENEEITLSSTTMIGVKA